MSLGKRFIPVIAPDDERGTEFTTAMYDVEAVAANVHRGYKDCHHVRTLEVDLDDLAVGTMQLAKVEGRQIVLATVEAES